MTRYLKDVSAGDTKHHGFAIKVIPDRSIDDGLRPLALSVERSAGDAKRLARLANSHVLAQLPNGFHQFGSSFWLLGKVPNISEIFFEPR